MKVFTKIVIDIKSSKVIEQESFEYVGLVSYCGGSGGGGGGSGEIDYPDYMEGIHKNWITGSPVDAVNGEELSQNEGLTDVIISKLGNSPYSDKAAYDPSSAISNMQNAVSNYKTYLSSLDNSSTISNELSAYGYGKNDICASVSGSFDKAYQTLSNGMRQPKVQAEDSIRKLDIEVNRMSIAANEQQNETDRKVKEKDALWGLEIYQSGANLLGSISGGTLEKPSEETPSDTQKALAGALSGAASGAMIGAEVGMIGGPLGAALGAGIGVGAALLM